MHLIVNAEPRDVPTGWTIVNLLESLALPGSRVAVEVNRILIRRAQHGEHLLHDGDVIEIVTLVGGG